MNAFQKAGDISESNSLPPAVRLVEGRPPPNFYLPVRNVYASARLHDELPKRRSVKI
jgi:hypothetical protein